MKTYVVWNNKGGVGKSTIVFNLAARYAELNPTKNILVLDLCPQANVTMTILGGGTKGERNLLEFQTQSASIVGYVDDRISNRQPRQYQIQAHNYNNHLPKNLWLVPGDGNLELIAPAISYYANAQIPADAWSTVHLWIKDLVTRITDNSAQWAVFVDTNPSFSVYTELAIVAGTHLLVPFKADDSSRVATKALFALLYGSNPPHPVYGKYTFATKAKDAGLTLPLCQLFIGNQFTQYKGSAAAFGSMSDAVMDELFAQYKGNPRRYVDRGDISVRADFQKAFIYELRDFNSAGVVAAHQGRLLNQLAESTYDVHGHSVPLDKARIKTCSDTVDAIVQSL